MKFTFFLVSFTALFLWSCSPTVPDMEFDLYRIPEIKKTINVFSPDSSFIIKIPEDWISTLDEDCNCNEIWVVKKDFSMTIKVSNIIVSQNLVGNSEETKLSAVTNLIKGLTERRFSENFELKRQPKVFKQRNRFFSDFEFLFLKEQYGRKIVFKEKTKYYEIFAYTSDLSSDKSETKDELFSIQQYILDTFYSGK